MSLIREMVDEIHEIVTNINHAFVNGEFDHLPDPLEERDRLISQYLTIRLDNSHEAKSKVILPEVPSGIEKEPAGDDLLP